MTRTYQRRTPSNCFHSHSIHPATPIPIATISAVIHPSSPRPLAPPFPVALGVALVLLATPDKLSVPTPGPVGTIGDAVEPVTMLPTELVDAVIGVVSVGRVITLPVLVTVGVDVSDVGMV